jgi:apolipoprotein N-acyltransferase
MQETAVVNSRIEKRRLRATVEGIRANSPSIAEVSLASASALFVVLAFPDFDLWLLAWIGLAPLLMMIGLTPRPARMFVIGWIWGAIFFYGSCWWLTYSMIRYGHLTPWLAYVLLFLPVALVAIFPALFCLLLARLVRCFGQIAIFAAPLLWVSLELVRYAVTGQVWNAIGYSQAFHPQLVHSASWGGVYAVSFIVIMVNSAVAFLLLQRTRRAIVISATACAIVIALVVITNHSTARAQAANPGIGVFIVAVQPNVPMEGVDNPTEQQLLQRHFDLSTQALDQIKRDSNSRAVVIWPESPMSFGYSRDPRLRELLARFTQSHSASLMLNSMEPAPHDGEYNSAILINEQGRKAAQYDKIRLMPFGEYVPLPNWLPGASSVHGIVGEFAAGSSFTLMPLGDLRAGVFICVEAAHPAIARTFTNEGADVLVNISNDGYLGQTAVMRQHLANAVFRAIENDRPLVRVTNTGISAFINSDGSVHDQTNGFQTAVRTWTVNNRATETTFYSRHGDVFVYGCALISLGIISATFMTRRTRTRGN